jgi:hypothetical protein
MKFLWASGFVVMGAMIACQANAQTKIRGAGVVAACPAGAQVTAGLTALLTSRTVCASVAGGDKWQEFHTPGGVLVDYKRGATDPVDPTTQVGTWSIDTANSTVTYNYGPSAIYTYIVCGVPAATPTSFIFVPAGAGTLITGAILIPAPPAVSATAQSCGFP